MGAGVLASRTPAARDARVSDSGPRSVHVPCRRQATSHLRIIQVYHTTDYRRDSTPHTSLSSLYPLHRVIMCVPTQISKHKSGRSVCSTDFRGNWPGHVDVGWPPGYVGTCISSRAGATPVPAKLVERVTCGAHAPGPCCCCPWRSPWREPASAALMAAAVAAAAAAAARVVRAAI